MPLIEAATAEKLRSADPDYLCSFNCCIAGRNASTTGCLHVWNDCFSFPTPTGEQEVITFRQVVQVNAKTSSISAKLFGSTKGRAVEIAWRTRDLAQENLSVSLFDSDADLNFCLKLLTFLWHALDGSLSTLHASIWGGFLKLKTMATLDSTAQVHKNGQVQQCSLCKVQPMACGCTALCPKTAFLAAVMHPVAHKEVAETFGVQTIITCKANSASWTSVVEILLFVGSCTMSINNMVDCTGRVYLTNRHVCFCSQTLGSRGGKGVQVFIELHKLLAVIVQGQCIELLTIDSVYHLLGLKDLDASRCFLAAWFAAIQGFGNNKFNFDQVKRLWQQFRSIVSGRDFRLFEEDFGAVSDCLWGSQLSSNLFNAFDRDASGFIDFQEFVQGMRLMMMGTPREHLEFCVRIFDVDGDGLLSQTEFEALISTMQRTGQLGNQKLNTLELYEACCQRGGGEVSVKDLFQECISNPVLQPLLKGWSQSSNTNLNMASPSHDSSTSFVTFGNPNWKTVVSVLQGIKEAVIVTSAKFSQSTPPAPLSTHNKSEFKLMALDTVPSLTVSIDSGPSAPKLTAYQPELFHHIRSHVGLTPKTYINSLGLDLLIRNMLFGTLTTLTELSSSGRSGSLLFLSPDEECVIKRIPADEAALLASILPTYFDHICRHPDTLLCHFFGLYGLTLDGKKSYWVVMRNSMPPFLKMDEVYDLKGSTAGRTTPSTMRTNTMVALKDNDLQEQLSLLDEEECAALLTQLLKDSAFLTNHRLIDYSLLVGICSRETTMVFDKSYHTWLESHGSWRIPSFAIRSSQSMNPGTPQSAPSPDAFRPNPPPGQEARSGMRFRNGVSASCGQRIYFFGVIDILTVFNMKRATESTIKSVVLPNASIVPPEEYGKRFINFLRSIIVSQNSRGEDKPLMQFREQHLAAHVCQGIQKSLDTLEKIGPSDAGFYDFRRLHTCKLVDSAGVVKQFKAHVPQIFQQLREVFGTPLEEYKAVWNSSAQANPTRRGSMQFMEYPRHFVIKTVLPSAADTFLTILPAYYRYLTTELNSLIARVFGLYSISHPTNPSERNFNCVVLRDCFSTCTFRELYRLTGEVPSSSDGQTLGLDSMVPCRLCVPSHARHALLRQLALDLQFLASHHIIDYAVMVGVMDPSEKMTQGLPGVHILNSPDDDLQFWVGIVDVLAQPRTVKNAQASATQAGPAYYGERLYQYVAAAFITTTNLDDDVSSSRQTSSPPPLGSPGHTPSKSPLGSRSDKANSWPSAPAIINKSLLQSPTHSINGSDPNEWVHKRYPSSPSSMPGVEGTEDIVETLQIQLSLSNQDRRAAQRRHKQEVDALKKELEVAKARIMHLEMMLSSSCFNISTDDLSVSNGDEHENENEHSHPIPIIKSPSCDTAELAADAVDDPRVDPEVEQPISSP